MLVQIARAAILVLAAALRLWRLDQNGYDNEYYAAAVRSIASGWHAFFYNAFDPTGFVSVDKPPVALWLQALAVKLFGFHGLTVLLPQVVEGVAAVALLDYLVRRRLGAWAGLLAGLFLAVMPVSVATDRSNNTESCLVLVLLLAAWALLVAAEGGSRWLLMLSAALISLGFNVKMLAAFVVLPAFALVYALGAPLGWRRRIADLSVAGVVLVTLSLSWAVVYDLTPPDRRPFAGSTKRNSMVELAVDHNGLGRFVRLSRPTINAGVGNASVGNASVGATGSGPAGVSSGERTSQGSGGRWARLFVRTPVGTLRLANGQLAGQVGWFLPLALLGVTAAFLGTGRRLPLDPVQMSLLLWVAWAFTYGVVCSYAGGIFHYYYYLVLMAPPLAALAGIGVRICWAVCVRGGWLATLVPAALLATAAWQLYIERSAVGRALPLDACPRVGTGTPRHGRGRPHRGVARAARHSHGVGAQQRPREGHSRSALRRPGAARSGRDGNRRLSARSRRMVPKAHRVSREQSEGRALPVRHVHHARRRAHHHRDGRAGHGHGRLPRARPYSHAGEARPVGCRQPGALRHAGRPLAHRSTHGRGGGRESRRRVDTRTRHAGRCGAMARGCLLRRRIGRFFEPRAGEDRGRARALRPQARCGAGSGTNGSIGSPGRERGESGCVASTSSWRASSPTGWATSSAIPGPRRAPSWMRCSTTRSSATS